MKIMKYRITFFVITLWVVATCSTGFADTSINKDLMDQEFKDSMGELLSPDQIETFKKVRRASEKAIRNPRPKPISRTIKVSLNPGAPIPLLKLIPNFATPVSFFDNTGQPWPVKVSTPGNDTFFQVDRPENVAPGNSITISAKTDYANTNVVALLEGQSMPLSIFLTTVDPDKDAWEMDGRIAIQVDQPGPNASIPVVGEPIPSSISETVYAFVDGVPPVDALKLSVSPEIPVLDVWLYKEKLYIRSSNPLQWPKIQAIAPGVGGTLKVYEAEKASSLQISHNGQTKEITLSEPIF